MHHPACAVPNRSETSTNQNFRLKGKILDYDNPEYLFFLLLNNDMNFYAIRRFLSLLDASGYVNIHMGIKLLMATIAKDLQIWL